MGSEKCSCWHHWCARLLGILAWVAAIGYVAVSWGWSSTFLGQDATTLFEHVIVLSLLTLGTSICNCCCGKACCGTCSMK